MTRLFASIFNLFLIGSAFAQGAAPEGPEPEASGYVTVIFIVLFVGFCVGIVWMIMRGGKNEETPGKGETKAGPPA